MLALLKKKGFHKCDLHNLLQPLHPWWFTTSSKAKLCTIHVLLCTQVAVF